MNEVKQNLSQSQPRSMARLRISKLCLTISLLAGAGLTMLCLIPAPARAQGPVDMTEVWFAEASDNTQSVAWGDMDGDGDLDLAVGNSGTDGLNRLYRNEGGGSFSEIPNALGTATDTTSSLAWGDMDGDGDLDLVVGNYGSANKIYQNEGEGSFTEIPGALGTAPDDTESVAWGDMDGDGDLDLAVGNYQQPNRVYQNNNGALNFSPIYTSTDSKATLSVAWGDMDGDGDLDLAVGNSDSANELYLNQGGGSFTEISDALGIALDDTKSVAWGDMDGDGDLDLAVGNSGSANELYLNQGGGSFTEISDALGTINDTTRSLAWGDVDGDGDLDLAVGNYGSANKIYQNEGEGSFTEIPDVLGTAADYTFSLAWGDMDGDGDLDLAVGNFHGGLNRLYRNEVDSSFFVEIADKLGEDWDNTQSVAWGDMDGDGDLDLASGSVLNLLYRNEGENHFSAHLYTFDSFDTPSVAWGDMDADGDLDLAVGNYLQPNKVYQNNNGILSFSPIYTSVESMATRNVAWGDMDGDGDLDLVVGNSGDGLNRLYRNEGGGSFTEIPDALGTAADNTYSLAWGDVDGDGDLDLAVGNSGSANKIYQNEGESSFTEIPGALGTAADNTYSLAWGDMDGDGDLDLAVGNSGSDGLNRLYRNGGGGNFAEIPGALGYSTENSFSLAWGDMDGDGDLDLAVGNDGSTNKIYRNEGGGSFSEIPIALDPTAENTISLAWGDMDGDGDLDLALANSPIWLIENTRQGGQALPNNLPAMSAGRPYTSIANFYAQSSILAGPTLPLTYTLFDPEGDPVGRLEAFYSFNGGDNWRPAVATSNTITSNLTTGQWLKRAGLTPSQTIPADSSLQANLVVTDSVALAEVEVWLTITHPNNADLAVALRSPAGTQVPLFSTGSLNGSNLIGTVFDDQAATPIIAGMAPYTGTYRPEGNLAAFKGQSSSGTWTLAITNTEASSGTLIAWGLRLKTPPVAHVYNWDTFASGFFGRSDNVVIRMVAYPQAATPAISGTYRYPNSAAGPFQRPYASATTFPFRVRGTQVRVLNGTTPISNALVYRLPAGQETGGFPLPAAGSEPFRTDANGYLQGRGQIGIGDRLLALAPVPLPPEISERYSNTLRLYYTNGTPTETGLDTFTVEEPGVQELVVSADKPLLLFDLDVSLEWDAHTDPLYLDQLEFDLKRASQHLYDFTDGQVALGDIIVSQNADFWRFAHIDVHATNRLRPYATIGGAVVTETVDFEPALGISYDIGQIHMGSVWNRYGNPAQSLGVDWPLVLAHELGHYLLFLEDTYLGLKEVDGAELLVSVNSCQGSAMGDVYNINNTEFVFNDTDWQNNCGQTLAQQELQRDEWQTIRGMYDDFLIEPTTVISGPSLMPFALTTVDLRTPLTSTQAIEDPTFFLDYQDNAVGSSEARAFLLRNENNEVGTPATTNQYEYVYDLGSPVGGQNRLLARGAQPGDRLCVFDPALSQFGCEIISVGDERLALKRDTSWMPVIQISPVNSTTFILQVAGLTDETLDLRARLYPEFGEAFDPQPLAFENGVYSSTLTLDYPALKGDVQVWLNEGADTPPYQNPRRETIFGYRIGGNPGTDRGSGGTDRGSGGTDRGSGGTDRGSGGTDRGSGTNVLGEGGAPAVSSDGQMIYFDRNFNLAEGQFYTVQNMAGLPDLPPGKVAIGKGYNLFATGFVMPTEALTGSISFQYLGNDVLVEERSEDELGIHFWNGSNWLTLKSEVDTTFNLASARSQGPGVYALLAGVTTPEIDTVVPSAATNEVTNTLVISGSYFLEPVNVALVGPTATYTLPLVSVSPYSITAVVSRGLQAREYQVVVANLNQPGEPAVSPMPGTFALYDPAEACFYDFFESGAGKWETGGDWGIVILPSGERAMTDSPLGTYNNAITPTLTYTTAITSHPPFPLNDCTNPVLAFRHDYVIDNRPPSQDVGRVEISTDDGATWTELVSYRGGYDIPALEIQNVTSPEWTAINWKDVQLSLSTYSGTVTLRFSLEVDQFGADKGWVLDNVRVQSGPPPGPGSGDLFLPIIFKEE